MPLPAPAQPRRLAGLLVVALAALLGGTPAVQAQAHRAGARHARPHAHRPAVTGLRAGPVGRLLLRGLLGSAPATGASAPIPSPGHATAPPVVPALLAPALPALAPLTSAPLAGTPDGAPVPSPAPAPAPTPTPTPTALGVQASETPTYRMLLSRATVAAGDVRVQLRDTGEDPHNLVIARTDGTGDAIAVPLTQPGAATTQTVRLSPGTYRFYCSLTAPVVHEAAGMRATLVVTG